MRTRMWASYGAVAAGTALAATVLAACEPPEVTAGAAPIDWSAALDWSEAGGGAAPVERSGVGAAPERAPAARAPRS